MAPEVLSRKPYDEKADVYRLGNAHPPPTPPLNGALIHNNSYGIILWELITGAHPFQEQLFEDFSGTTPL